MGCDIHAHLEIKVKDEWMYYAPAYIERWYDLFAYMADVRNYNEVEPISRPRGLPSDITQMTVLHRQEDGPDGYSDSWLSYPEICKAVDWVLEHQDMAPEERWRWRCQSFGIWLFGSTIRDWAEYPDSYPDYLEDIRLVFWFD